MVVGNKADDANAHELTGEMNFLSLEPRPLKSILKRQSGLKHPPSSVPTIDYMASATTAIAEPMNSSTAATIATVTDVPPGQMKVIRWKDNHPDAARRGMLGYLIECQEFDVSQEEREWKRSGKVTKWKVSMRLLKLEARQMLKARKERFVKDVKKKIGKVGDLKEVEEMEKSRTTVRKANQMEQVARFKEAKARRAEFLVENAEMRKKMRERRQKLAEKEKEKEKETGSIEKQLKPTQKETTLTEDGISELKAS